MPMFMSWKELTCCAVQSQPHSFTYQLQSYHPVCSHLSTAAKGLQPAAGHTLCCYAAGLRPTFGDHLRVLEAVITTLADKATPDSQAYKMVSTAAATAAALQRIHWQP